MSLLHHLFTRVRRRLLPTRAAPASPVVLKGMLALAARDGDLPEVHRLCAELLALAPDDAQVLEVQGQAWLLRGDPVAACQAHAAADRVRLGPGVSTQVFTSSWMDPGQANLGRPYVACLDEVRVDPGYWIVFQGDRAFVKETQDRNHANSPLVRHRLTPDATQFIATLPAPTVSIDETCILLGGDHNYAHWLTRNLIKLALLEHGACWAGLPMLINAELRPYQTEFLSMLGISLDRLIQVSPHDLVACRRLVVPTVLVNRPTMGWGIDWLRRSLAAHLADEGAASDLIYLSRRDSKVRHLLNEAELLAALTPLGFDLLVAGGLSAREQIQRFSRAKVIVAVHGAGLANLVFAPSGAVVVEVTSGLIEHMEDFGAIAALRGQTFIKVVSRDYGPPPAGPHNPMHRDFSVDVAEVLDALHRALPGTFPPSARGDEAALDTSPG